MQALRNTGALFDLGSEERVVGIAELKVITPIGLLEKRIETVGRDTDDARADELVGLVDVRVVIGEGGVVGEPELHIPVIHVLIVHGR